MVSHHEVQDIADAFAVAVFRSRRVRRRHSLGFPEPVQYCSERAWALANMCAEANLHPKYVEHSFPMNHGGDTVAKTGKTEGVNKSQAIRDYLATNADAMPNDVIAALKEKGIKVSRGLVGLVKYKNSAKKAGKKKAGRKTARVAASRSGAKGGNKSGAVRAYLAANPDASPVAVAEALKKMGIKISVSLASAVKYSKKGKKAGRPKGRRGPGRPKMAASSRSSSNGALNLETLVEAKRLAERMGGIEKVREALAVLAKLA